MATGQHVAIHGRPALFTVIDSPVLRMTSEVWCSCWAIEINMGPINGVPHQQMVVSLWPLLDDGQTHIIGSPLISSRCAVPGLAEWNSLMVPDARKLSGFFAVAETVVTWSIFGQQKTYQAWSALHWFYPMLSMINHCQPLIHHESNEPRVSAKHMNKFQAAIAASQAQKGPQCGRGGMIKYEMMDNGKEWSLMIIASHNHEHGQKLTTGIGDHTLEINYYHQYSWSMMVTSGYYWLRIGDDSQQQPTSGLIMVQYCSCKIDDSGL